MEGKFKVGDRVVKMYYQTNIEQVGYIAKGPFEINGVNHYQFQPIWCSSGYEYLDTILISDKEFGKYQYESFNGKWFEDNELVRYLNQDEYNRFRIAKML